LAEATRRQVLALIYLKAHHVAMGSVRSFLLTTSAVPP